MKKTYNLELIFKNGEDKASKLTIKDPKTNLSPETVASSMVDIAQANLFTKEGVPVYGQVQGARYITRTVEEIIDLTA